MTLSESDLVIHSISQKDIEDFLAEQIKRLRQDYWVKTRKGKWWWSYIANYFFAQQTNPDQFLLTPSKLLKLQRSKWRVGTCDFCNRTNLKTKAAGTTENPFMVVPERMSSFYSNLQGKISICENCTFATKFSPKSLFFTINFQDQRLLAFCFEAPGLVSLDRAYLAMSRLITESESYRNFKCLPTAYPMETFASFLTQLQQEIAVKRKMTNLIDQLNVVHIISMIRSGKTTTVERYYVLPNLPRLLELVNLCQWDSREKTYNALAEILKIMFYKQGNKFNSVPREAFCFDLFNMRPISQVLENFVYERLGESERFTRFYAINLYKLIRSYYIGFLNMDENIIKVTRGIGEALAELAHSEDHKSLLFSLRSCRNHEDVLAFFEQILTRYTPQGNSYSEVPFLLKALDKSNWREYKCLMSIYAALKYSELESALHPRKPIGVAV